MSSKTIHASGTVEAFNVSPKGSYEGFLLNEKSKTAQVNFPQEWSGVIALLAKVGSVVEVEAEEEKKEGRPQHSVYRLIRLRNASGKSWPGQEGIEEGEVEFAGKIERLNYALHGEVNGVILDSGDFVHTKPHGAAVVKLAVGESVTGRGKAKLAAAARRVIDAKEVNGVRLEQHGPKEAHA